MEPIQVAKLPLHRPVILEDRNTLKQIALAMSQSDVGSVIIADRTGELLGVITDRDLAFALTIEQLEPDRPAIDALITPILTIDESGSLEELIDLMETHAIRRVPVISNSGKATRRCIGVVSLDDLIKAKLITIDDAAKILRAQLPRPNAGGRTRLRRLFSQLDNREQVANEFVHKIANGTGLSAPNARSFLIHVLGAVLQRVPVNSGRKFLSQLPSELRMELEPELNDGPIDRRLTGQAIIDELGQRYALSETEVHEMLQKFWSAMGQQISAGDLQNLGGLLPKKMQKELELTH